MVNIHADVRETDTIIADARNVLNFRRPVAIILIGILGHAAHDYDTMRDILARLMAAVPVGSYLVLADGVETDDDVYKAGIRVSGEKGNPYKLRTLAEFTGAFEGMYLVDPGVVPLNLWRPDDVEVGGSKPSSGHAAVGLKV